ncbi:methylthioribulose 1-phosphate dehydratase [Paenibacillus macerans]|uniref:Methylthioribulose-1-phosphate dehydratase n=1 Tax=Paenibacillus macerans TaxID=44252 RepID=A0A090YAX9_PAEMA|nr:methylthioribulose 1-phosphate dehydratase [Paenibacillus macerans]KFM95943.1 methylthioribulose-1-phosphate dehydratase [Paenibacillus macerans]MBS5914499.1 methylthioribulose 1-phosphate dehydratase [Paenibacillus macerans]MCY7558835.1 methylthioribulose 1-phosphate dehydratase [Paenibacillus macerans]MEC0139797.1 methylthioribulose 1-phosphate dehydratase [Paenibacillus macerans]MEC0153039.1 methylthioribulose 1-phosphate dehydratase [Paenibacillus macerans]
MNFSDIPLEEKQAALSKLRGVKEQLAARGWLPAMSGSLSVRVGSFAPGNYHFAVTSGMKGRTNLPAEEFLFVDAAGTPSEATKLTPGDDAPVHAKIYRMTGCGAILHVHTVFNNVLSEYFGDEGFVQLQGNELIKALGIWEEDAAVRIPVVPNYADIAEMERRIPAALDTRVPGLLLRGHGIYAWGSTAFDAVSRLEAFEFMFEALYRSLLLPRKQT